jgi:type IV pilus assembly protein PilM
MDLGVCQTKAVHLQKRGGSWSLVSFAFVDAPPPEKSREVAVLAEHFKAVVAALGNPKARALTVALGVEETILRQIELPMMAPEDVRQMLKLSSKTYLQQELSDYVFDAFYLPPRQVAAPAEPGKTTSTSQKYKVLVAGAPRARVEAIQAAARAAGLVAEDIIPSLIGPANAFECVEPQAFNSEVVGLVDVGFRTTTIVVLDGGELVLNRVVQLGGERLTAGLAEAMGISTSEAEGLKVGMPTEVQPTLEAVLNPLGRELRASLDFFEHQNDKPIAQVMISGGSARNDIIVQALQNELMVPCRSWNPTRFLQVAVPEARVPEVEQAGPQLSVAIGSAAACF